MKQYFLCALVDRDEMYALMVCQSATNLFPGAGRFLRSVL